MGNFFNHNRISGVVEEVLADPYNQNPENWFLDSNIWRFHVENVPFDHNNPNKGTYPVPMFINKDTGERDMPWDGERYEKLGKHMGEFTRDEHGHADFYISASLPTGASLDHIQYDRDKIEVLMDAYNNRSDADKVSQAQKILLEDGFLDPGDFDAKFGPMTRGAIRRYRDNFVHDIMFDNFTSTAERIFEGVSQYMPEDPIGNFLMNTDAGTAVRTFVANTSGQTNVPGLPGTKTTAANDVISKAGMSKEELMELEKQDRTQTGGPGTATRPKYK